jgi:hypothetical protein
MYMRTPALHEPGSVWPTRDGMAVSKDSWMFGMGMGFLIDSVGRQWRERRRITRAAARLRADLDRVEASS